MALSLLSWKIWKIKRENHMIVQPTDNEVRFQLQLNNINMCDSWDEKMIWVCI